MGSGGQKGGGRKERQRGKPEEEETKGTQAGPRGPPPSPRHRSVPDRAAGGGGDEWKGADGLTEARGTWTPSREQPRGRSRRSPDPRGLSARGAERFHCPHTHCLRQQLRDLGARRTSVDPELWKGGVTVPVGAWRQTHWTDGNPAPCGRGTAPRLEHGAPFPSGAATTPRGVGWPAVLTCVWTKLYRKTWTPKLRYRFLKCSVWLKALGPKSKLVLRGKEQEEEESGLKRLCASTFMGSGLRWQLPPTFFFSRMQMIKID